MVNKNYLHLNLYKNDSSSSFKTLDVASYDDTSVTFQIKYSFFNVGDTLTGVRCVYTGSKQLYDLNEGVTLLIDGEEVANIHSNTYTYDSDSLKQGEHTIQAVYQGSDSLTMVATEPKTFNMTNTTQNGQYKLEFVDDKLKTLVWGDGTNIKFRLTRGGVPVANKTVEIIPPKGGEPWSADTDSNGLVGFTNSNPNFKVGDMKIGAYFNESQTLYAKVYKDITINKASAKIVVDTSSTYHKGDYLKIKFRDNLNNDLTNEKVTVYVNGHPHTRKTTSNGNFLIKLKNATTYKFKAVFLGNNTTKKTESNFDIVVSQ